MSAKTILIRKQELARTLQSVDPHPDPKAYWEQYTIPADLAADILFLACHVHGDIDGKSVLDLGTGTGRLAIGASILGARYVVGIDIDRLALSVASDNCRRLDLEIDWLLGEVGGLRGRVDTVLMNPPFGTRQPHADVKFLQIALKLAKTVYTIHKTSTRQFLERWLRQHHANSARAISTEMEIPHQFHFHTKRRDYVPVDVLRIKPS
jgi:putative methylase